MLFIKIIFLPLKFHFISTLLSTCYVLAIVLGTNSRKHNTNKALAFNVLTVYQEWETWHKSAERHSDKHTKHTQVALMGTWLKEWGTSCLGTAGTASEEWELCWHWRKRRLPTSKGCREGEFRQREWHALCTFYFFLPRITFTQIFVWLAHFIISFKYFFVYVSPFQWGIPETLLKH